MKVWNHAPTYTKHTIVIIVYCRSPITSCQSSSSASLSPRRSNASIATSMPPDSSSSSKSKSMEMIWLSSVSTCPTSMSFSQNSSASGQWVRCSKAVKEINKMQLNYDILRVPETRWDLEIIVTQYNNRYILSTFQKIEIFVWKCEFPFIFFIFYYTLFCSLSQNKPGRQDVPFVVLGHI